MPAIVATVAAMRSASSVAPAPAKPSRIPAVAMIPSFATAVQDRSDASSVSTAWIPARRSRGGVADAKSPGSVVTRRSYDATNPHML